MLIFLDTNTISHFHTPNHAIIDKVFNAISKKMVLCTTIINKYEIIRGFKWRPNPKRETMFIDFLNNLDIYSINDYAIELAADIYGNLRKKGTPIEDADILIAAIVIANNGTLITSNIKHFESIDNLKYENWL